MSRMVEEWIGKTDDAAIPRRVKDRIIERNGNQCAECSRFLRSGFIAFDHTIALINGGEHRESNIRPICTVPCHEEKTRQDVAIKSKIARVRARHLGIKPNTSRPIPGSKASGIRKRMNGNVERRPAE